MVLVCVPACRSVKPLEVLSLNTHYRVFDKGIFSEKIWGGSKFNGEGGSILGGDQHCTYTLIP